MSSLLALDCGYHHVVFTVPHELNELFRWNRSWFADQVMAASRETLLQLLGEPKWLGALPGLVQSWHTWGRNLIVHPHVHVLVTAGGWTDSGWKHLCRDYLLPSKVLRSVYRGKLQSRLRAGLSSGEMVLPAGQDVISVRRLLQRLYRKQWSVNVQSRYGHGRGVLTYLGNYVRGGPVREHQLQSLSPTSVTFRHLDHRDKRIKPCTLSIEDFLLRLSEHVPEKGFQAVRYSGLYASSHRAMLAQARASLGMAPAPDAPVVLSAQDFLERVGSGDKMCCSTCDRRLVQGARIERSDRAPPYVEYRDAA